MIETIFLSADPLGGINGWITAIASIGLLGPVLYWLCYHHIPSKDKQMMEVGRMHADDVRKIIESSDTRAKEERGVFQAALDKVVGQCVERIIDHHEDCMVAHAGTQRQLGDQMKEQRHYIHELAHLAGLDRAVEKLEKKKREELK